MQHQKNEELRVLKKLINKNAKNKERLYKSTKRLRTLFIIDIVLSVIACVITFTFFNVSYAIILFWMTIITNIFIGILEASNQVYESNMCKYTGLLMDTDEVLPMYHTLSELVMFFLISKQRKLIAILWILVTIHVAVLPFVFAYAAFTK